MTVPWLTTINTSPWQASGQMLYVRTVSVRRSKTIAGITDAIGGVGYSGTEQGTVSIEGEVILLTGLPAAIQMGAVGRTTKSGQLPGDAVSKPVWNILIPASAISQYYIRDRDIIIDDESYRYEVSANAWSSLGYHLSTIRLEA